MVEKKQLRLPPDQKVEVDVLMPDGTAYPNAVRVNFADPSFSQETGSFLIRAEIPNPERGLRPGMFVTAKVKGGTRENAVIVPQLSVQQGATGHVVYVIKTDGVAELRPVVVGDYHG